MSSKRWICFVLIGSALMLGMMAFPTWYYDPYFHYRAPEHAYELEDERYQNDGIVKHFSYDAMIAGTSMVENFKTSELDALFNVRSIKVPLYGASYKEVNDNIKTAIAYNTDLKLIVRGLDLSHLNEDKNHMVYDNYPTYLYDENPLNDTQYVLNKSVLFNDTFQAFEMNQKGECSSSFDEYGRWQEDYPWGKEAVLKLYERPEQSTAQVNITQEDILRVKGNINQNIVQTAKDNPNIHFFLYMTPYSIAWWDSMNRTGQVQYQIDLIRVAMEEMLQCSNIYLFFWSDNTDLVCNLNFYRDSMHYTADVNSFILNWMKCDVGRVTKDNYLQYIEKIEELYHNYQYDGIFVN